LHEIVAALIPDQTPHEETQEAAVTQVSVTRETPAPKPTPTANPPATTHARVVGPVAPQVAHRTKVPLARNEAVRNGAARPKPPQFSHVKPIWELSVGAQGAGSGNDAGSGGARGGTGNGGRAGATQPCGFVEFSDPHGSRYDAKAGGYWVDVVMTVHFPDRHTESLMLDYAWFYPNAASNPWSQQNLDDPNFPTGFQSPPPDKRPDEPALVQYVIAHSNGEGLTLLKNCP
jgi:hypothetical protein